jgi:hypothetical protein
MRDEPVKDSKNPNYVQPPWQPPKHCSGSTENGVLGPGWMAKVMTKTPVQKLKQDVFNQNCERILIDGPAYYAWKEANPHLNLPDPENQTDSEGKPTYHLYQQGLNPWVQHDDGNAPSTILMRSTHTLQEDDDEMKEEFFL